MGFVEIFIVVLCSLENRRA